MSTFIDRCLAGQADINKFYNEFGVLSAYGFDRTTVAGMMGLSLEEFEHLYWQLGNCVPPACILLDVYDAREMKVQPCRVNNVYCLQCNKIDNVIHSMRAPFGSVVAAVGKCNRCEGSKSAYYHAVAKLICYRYQGPIFYFDKDGNSLGGINTPEFVAEEDFEAEAHNSFVLYSDAHDV